MHTSPFVFHPAVLLMLLLAGIAGTLVRRRFPEIVATDHSGQFTGLQASVLALLGLLLGFSFSMAVGRFDDRRQAEIAEGTAIGIVDMRISTLDADSAATQRKWMREYVRARIAFYDGGNDPVLLGDARSRTADLHRLMWAAATRAQPVGGGERDPESYVASYLTSLTQAFGAAEHRQAAYENRIPKTAWALLIMVAAVANFLVGLGVWRWNGFLLLILPIVVSSTLTLIYDLDSPRSGLIHVRQDSMERVQQTVESGH